MVSADDYIASSGSIKWVDLAAAVFGATFLTIVGGIQSVYLMIINAARLTQLEVLQHVLSIVGGLLEIPSRAMAAGGTETADWMSLFGTFAAPVSIAVVLAGFAIGIWVSDNV